MSSSKVKAYDLLSEHDIVHFLVPSNVSDDEIYQTYCRTSVNSASVKCPCGTSAIATYLEYSLLNHMCRPNCSWEGENGDVSVYALEDIEPNRELGISYLGFRYCINLREIRRKELKEAFGFDCSCFVCLEEEKIGSKYWLLDQKKRSLIAPWSRKLADDVMEKGWKMLYRSGSMELPEAIKLLELSLRSQKGVLDKNNIILILTAIFLLYKCVLAKQYKEGMCHFKSIGKEGMEALFEYGTLNETEFVGLDINTCCYELGLEKESQEISDLMQKLFPKVPSADRLCDDLWDEGFQYNKVYATTIEHLEEDMDVLAATGEVVTHLQDKVSSYIADLCSRLCEL